MTSSSQPAPDPRALRQRVLACAPPALLRELTRPPAPRHGATILAAVSGGADSVSLAGLLAALAPGRGWNVVVATLDHGLRGVESADDRLFVESLARALGVPCIAGTRPVRSRPGRSHETLARRVRRAFLGEAARRAGATAIALGHTADDQAETVLFRLARGAGARGLGGMRRSAGPLWRPLLDVRRATLRALLSRAGISWREDATNDDRAAARNRIRHDVLPALERALGDSAVAAVVRAARLARDDEAFLTEEAARHARSVVVRDDRSGTELDRRALIALPPALASRIARQALSRRVPGSRLTAAHVDALLRLARAAGPGTRAHLPRGVAIERRGPAVVIEGRLLGGRDEPRR